MSDPLLDRLRLATLGTYDVAGELGRGGMAIVYVAKDLKLGRTVAIKVMDPRLSLAHGMAERFLQEARIAANLQHPNIIVVHDVKQNEDLIFFVMSLIEGGAVDELCRDCKSLPIEQVRWILLQATRALAHAHSEGIIHRDVKPANVLINLKGDVILTDFGIAKAVGGNGMTQSGTQIGTPTYMSPEQFADRPVGSASDQYALGVTAYQLLTGKPPFTGDLYQLIAAHGSKLPVPIRELRPDCPAYLANAVMRMLEKRAEDRWPVLDDLQGVFGANMAMDGGVARKQLAVAAQHMQRQRTTTIAPLSAKTPVSPIPVGSSRLRPEATAPSESLVVSISPPGATIYVGGILELKASVASESGEPAAPSAVVWTTSNSEILSVNGDGRLRGVSTGSAVVRAAVPGAFEEATIRVESAPITRLTVTVPNLTLKVGDVAHPTVSAIDANGQSRADISLSWISRAPSVALLESPGSIRALTPGAATVEVSSGNVRRLIEVTVVRRPVASVRIRPTTRLLELGDASALFADALNDLGEPVRQPAPRWTSSAPHVVHVDSAGTALAIGPGVAEITVEIDDASDSVELEAIEAPIGAIDIKLTAHHVEVGDEVPFILEVRDQVGAFRSATGVRVWSSAPGIAEVDTSAMVVRAMAVGEVKMHAADAVSAASGAVKAPPAQLTVSAATIARIELFPTSVDLEPGAVASLSAHYFDRLGRAVPNVPGQWQSAAPGVVTVGSSGVVCGVSAGTSEIRHVATQADGRTCEASISVRVRRATIARLAVESTRKFLAVREAMDVVATAWDSSGAPAPDATPVWKSSDARVASVSDGGRVSALAPGRVIVTAEVDGRDGEVEMVVVAAPLTSLKVSLSAPQGIVGVPVRASAIARDATGNVTPALQWSVLPSQHARISAAGELVPLRAGMLSVTASIPELPAECVGISPGTRAASAKFEVREPRVESIKLDHDSVVFRIGRKRRIGAQVAIEGQKSMQRGAVNWSSNNPSIVRVLDSGELEAVALGDCTVLATSGEAQATLAVLVKAERFAAISLRTRWLTAAGVVAMIFAFIAWPAVLAVFRSSGTQPVIDSGAVSALQPKAGRTSSANGNGNNDSVKAAEASRAATAGLSGAQAQDGGSNTKADGVNQARSTVDTVPQVPLRGRAGQAVLDSIKSAQAKFKRDSVAALRNAEQRAAAQHVTEQRVAFDSAARADSLRRASVAREGRGQPTATDAANIDDVRANVDRIVQGFRTGAEGNAEVRKLLSDRRPSVELVPASVAIVSEEQGRMHAKFEVRLSSFNGVGIPKTRTAQVTFDVSGRRGATEVRNVQIGPLTKIP